MLSQLARVYFHRGTTPKEHRYSTQPPRSSHKRVPVSSPPGDRPFAGVPVLAFVSLCCVSSLRLPRSGPVRSGLPALGSKCAGSILGLSCWGSAAPSCPCSTAALTLRGCRAAAGRTVEIRPQVSSDGRRYSFGLAVYPRTQLRATGSRLVNPGVDATAVPQGKLRERVGGRGRAAALTDREGPPYSPEDLGRRPGPGWEGSATSFQDPPADRTAVNVSRPGTR